MRYHGAELLFAFLRTGWRQVGDGGRVVTLERDGRRVSFRLWMLEDDEVEAILRDAGVDEEAIARVLRRTLE